MRIRKMGSQAILSLLLVAMLSASVFAQDPSLSKPLMCIAGDVLFSDDFNPNTVSARWGFKADFALRDGALLRTDVDPTLTKRVFLKDASFHNAIIQFDFKLAGQTTDLRLVTGSGGHYNSITSIHDDYFQINTPIDRDAGYVPAQLGECIRRSRPDQWQTLVVEYWDDEMIVHLSDTEFILGRHPIINRTREYFAFQFDLPGAAIDNVRIWKSVRQRDDWNETRKKMMRAQTDRVPVKRNPIERYKIEYMNLKSRLTLNDKVYRDLVAKHDSLEAALHADFADAFITHKQFGKLIAKKKQKIKATDPDFKPMETAVHRASRAEDDYVLSTSPELVGFKKDGITKNRFASELGQVRAQLEAAGDRQLAALVAETAKRQAGLEARFPEAFGSVAAAVEKRNAIRKSLNNDPRFKARNKAVIDARNAINRYERKADPNLAQLEAASKGEAKK
jgi:hypothetical protein